MTESFLVDNFVDVMARLMTKWFNSVRGRGVGHEGRVKIYNAEIVIMESARGPQKLC